jgi:hypothetical protein
LQVYERLEQKLELLGATAVEDKLQPLVPETIAALRGAGIRMWSASGPWYLVNVLADTSTGCSLATSSPRRSR